MVGPLKGGESLADGHFLRASGELGALRRCQDGKRARMILLLLFRTDKTSLGVSRIGVATPWDDCPYAKSNDSTFVRARAYRVLLTSCVGINLGDAAPLGCPLS